MKKVCLIVILGFLCILASCSNRITVTPGRLPTSGTANIPVLPVLTPTLERSTTITPGKLSTSATVNKLTSPVLTTGTKQPASTTPTTSPTLMIPSSTPTRTATPTILYTPPVERCLNVGPSLPKDGAKGTLVLDTTLLNLETGSMTLIASGENETISQVRVSPNGQWLAYKMEIEKSGEYQENLVIATKESVTLTIPWKDGWSVLLGWLNNNRLLFRHDREPYSSVIVFDPFNNQSEQEVILDDPYTFIYDAPVLKNGKWTSFTPLSFTYYNPSLTRVVFYQSDKEGDWTTLQNLQTGEILTRLPNDFNISTMTLFTSLDAPVWISDGKEFLVEAGHIDKSELYRVTQDGEITRLTYLTEIYKYARVRGYSLSFDGHYIAFWYWADPYDRYRLATLDTTTGKVMDFCISGENHDQISVPDTPVWSHDSHQFVVEVPSGDLSNSQVIWVDVDNGSAAQIAKNLTPKGWLANP